jgi:hypothetical protein
MQTFSEHKKLGFNANLLWTSGKASHTHNADTTYLLTCLSSLVF